MPLEGLLAALLGAAHSLPFAHTWAWPAQLAVLAAIAWRVSRASAGRAASIGLVFGTAWLAAGTWWLFISLHTYGGLPSWLAVLSIALLSAFLSLYLAAALAAFARWRVGKAGRDALLFGAVWLLAELARGVIFTGFPWVASGYAHVDGPLASLAPWIGVYGIGFVGAVLSAWVVFGWGGARRGRALSIGAVAAVLGAAAFLGPGQFSRPGATLAVSLLQGNVAQDQKFALTAMPQALEWTRTNLLAARGDLVVAPETVIPLLPSQLDPAYWQAITDHFQRGSRAVLLGLPLGDPGTGYTNSAAGISAATAALPGGFYRYDKHHLVPFGEFIPFGFRWFTELMNIPLGDFNRGPLGAPSFVFRGERIGANICYEDLFGEELAARFEDEENAPTIFANLSNIGWFGDTVAIVQHLEISRMRALEFQRPMLRATNTGATAVIDHTGRVTASLPRLTQGVLEGQVQGRTGLTPFAWWAARFGLWPPLLMALAVVVASAASRARAPL
ncbi:MAG: apolipoprotein N-acyltransferase [Rhizobiales bacterium]|nr:apolipoprotein N-acyltransferase [Rhizobacter sp.]